MGGNEFALAMQCGYKQGYEDGGIEELKKLKEKIKDVLDLNNERDMLLPASYICQLVDKCVEELEG